MVKPVSRGESFEERVGRNKRVIKLFSHLDKGAYAIDTDALIQEMSDLHLARKYRNYSPNEFIKSAQMKLIEWTAEVDRLRSRCVAIKIEVIQIQLDLDQSIKDTRTYLLTRYKTELTRDYNTLADKKTAVDNVLTPFSKLLRKLDTVVKICDIIVADATNSHFSKESMIKTLDMNYNKTGG